MKPKRHQPSKVVKRNSNLPEKGSKILLNTITNADMTSPTENMTSQEDTILMEDYPFLEITTSPEKGLFEPQMDEIIHSKQLPVQFCLDQWSLKIDANELDFTKQDSVVSIMVNFLCGRKSISQSLLDCPDAISPVINDISTQFGHYLAGLVLLECLWDQQKSTLDQVEFEIMVSNCAQNVFLALVRAMKKLTLENYVKCEDDEKDDSFLSTFPSRYHAVEDILRLLLNSVFEADHCQYNNLVKDESTFYSWSCMTRQWLTGCLTRNRIHMLHLLLSQNRSFRRGTVSCQIRLFNNEIINVHVHPEVLHLNGVPERISDGYSFALEWYTRETIENVLDVMYFCLHPNPAIYITFDMYGAALIMRAYNLVESFLSDSRWVFWSSMDMFQIKASSIKMQHVRESAIIYTEEPSQDIRREYLKDLGTPIIRKLFACPELDISSEERYAGLVLWVIDKCSISCSSPEDVWNVCLEGEQARIKFGEVRDLIYVDSMLLTRKEQLIKQGLLDEVDLDNGDADEFAPTKG